MLSNRQKGWIPYVGILSVLIILLIYSQFRQKKYEVSIEPIFKFKTEDVASFTVYKDVLSVTIARQDSSWKFAAPDTGKPSSYKIDEFLKDVVKGQREGFITADTSTYAKYGVDGGQATKVELRSTDNVLAVIFVGQSPSDYAQEYFRYSNDQRVYPARQKMTVRLGAVASWWR
jgi:hypothetical protein